MNISLRRANFLVPAILGDRLLITHRRSPRFRRGGRAVDCAGLENRKAERPREFESHPLRRLDFYLALFGAVSAALKESGRVSLRFQSGIAAWQQYEVNHEKRAKDSQNRRADNIGQVMRADVHP